MCQYALYIFICTSVISWLHAYVCIAYLYIFCVLWDGDCSGVAWNSRTRNFVLNSQFRSTFLGDHYTYPARGYLVFHFSEINKISTYNALMLILTTLPQNWMRWSSVLSKEHPPPFSRHCLCLSPKSREKDRFCMCVYGCVCIFLNNSSIQIFVFIYLVIHLYTYAYKRAYVYLIYGKVQHEAEAE